jgi:hypothetical protein
LRAALSKSTGQKTNQKFVLSKTKFTFAAEQNVKMKAIYTYWRWWLSIFHILT